MNNRHTIIPAVYLFLKNKDDEYLLMRRFNTGYMDGYYSLAAGHLDGGESLKEAMIREGKEELDIIFTEEDLTLVHVSNNLISNPERIDFFFECNNWTGTPKINEIDKCDEILWVKLDSIPEKTTQTVKDAFKGIVDSELYSELR